jgi:acyl transferase domain-containing protein
VWEAAIDLHSMPSLRDHQVDGEVLFPATGHIELAWAAAGEQFRHEPFFLEDLHLDSPLILPTTSAHPLDVRLEVVSGEGEYRICSRPADAAREAPWSRHSSGRVNTTHDRFDPPAVTVADLRSQFGGADEVAVEPFNAVLRASGLEYGDHFRGVRQMWKAGDEHLARVELPADLLHETKRMTVHPALLDAALHVVFAATHGGGDASRVSLPYRIDRVRLHRLTTPAEWSHVTVTGCDDQYIRSDAVVFDDTGNLVAEVVGLTCKRLAGAGDRAADPAYEGCYEYRWVSAPRDPAAHGRIFDCATAVLVADAVGVCVELAERLAAEGVRPRLVRASPADSFDELLADVPLDRRCLIVFAAGLSRASAEPRSWGGLAACPAVPLLMQLVQTILKREGVPRLVVVTNGAAGLDADRDLGQAALHGMTRVVRNECANVPLQVVDLGETVTPAEDDALAHELLHCRRDRDESEIALRGSDRYLRHLTAVDRDTAEQAAAADEPGVGCDYRADVREPGVLDPIAFRRTEQTDPTVGEVEIAVEAAALNFKDVMNAMGLLPEHAVTRGLTGSRLGPEVAGRVLRVGPGVGHV